MVKGGFVYIITNKNHSVLYTGVTSNLKARIYEHRTKKYQSSFSARYNLNKLVYYGCFSTIKEAIDFEKKVKGWKRDRKIAMIQFMNPTWIDLYNQLADEF